MDKLASNMNEKKKLRSWKTLAREIVLDHSKFLTVENHTVELPDGQIISDWPWIKSTNAAIVLPVMKDGRFLCFRQTKYAVQGTTLAPVGGMIESDEAPLAAAKRELREEMGCKAGNWIDLGSYVLHSNYGIETLYLFLALGAEQVTTPDSDDLEEQELLVLSRGEIEEALGAGEFKVLAWTTVVSLSLNYLDANRK